MGIGIKELVVILIIVLLLFGTKRLKSLGTDLGSAIKGFRKSIQEDEPANLEQPPQARDEPAASNAPEQKAAAPQTDEHKL